MNVGKLAQCLICVCGFAASAHAADYQIGDTVVVIRDAQIKVGEKVLQHVHRGLGMKVQGVNGEWLWVANEAAGWVRKQDVATPDRAIEIFTEEIKRDARDADAYICRGLAWFDKNEFDIAIGDFNEAIRLDPKHSSAYGSRAICWWAKREVEKAIADCSEAIRIEPNEAMQYSNRGILWNMKGDYDKAIADADAAIRLAPDFVLPRIVRGNALTGKADYSRALAEFNEALRINPREATAFGLRGRVLATTGKYERAISDLDKAVMLDPKNRYACNELARFYATCPVEELRNGTKAVEFAEKACELSDWKWASAISVLAAAYAESGDFEKAVQWQEEATEMVPGKRRAEYRARLDLYKAGKPFRDEPRNLSSSQHREGLKKVGG